MPDAIHFEVDTYKLLPERHPKLQYEPTYLKISNTKTGDDIYISLKSIFAFTNVTTKDEKSVITIYSGVPFILTFNWEKVHDVQVLLSELKLFCERHY